MDKKLTFKWVSFTGDSEAYIGNYVNANIMVNYAFTEVGLDQIVETAKYVKNLKGVKALLGGSYKGSVVIRGLADTIQLIDSSDIDGYQSLYTILGKGPTVRWLLDNKKELSNPNPSKVMYTKDMAVQFVPSDHDESIIVTILNTEDTDHFSEIVEGNRIYWLGDKTFDEFLESYGYTDEDKNRDLVIILMLYQAGKELGFENPKEVVSYFCDSRLVVDLALKGVFEDLKESL